MIVQPDLGPCRRDLSGSGGARSSPERRSLPAAFAKAIAARQPEQFERLVKAAYEAGASREDLLTAVEVARVLADAPGPVVVEAYATVHTWRWVAARRRVEERG